MNPPAARSKRARIEATLAKYEEMNPDELDAEQRRFRSFAIRALKIELALQDRGFVENDARMVPAMPAKRRRRPHSRKT